MKFKLSLLIVLLIFSCINVNAANGILRKETATVTVGDVEVPILEVDITWGSMEFTFYEETNYIWKGSTKTYELGPTTYSWVGNDNYINISNKSYRDIEVELFYNSLYDDIEGNFNKKSEIIKKNDNVNFELNLFGKITNMNNNIINVGSIELLIS